MNEQQLLAMFGGGGSMMAPSRRENEGKSILSFKAGKMNTTLQQNGKYLVTPDPRRGTINMTWTSNTSRTPSSSNTSNSSSGGGILKFEWIDRRTRTAVDSLTIFPEDDCTYTKVNTGNQQDRVYLLSYGPPTSINDRMFFFWMQENEEKTMEDEENCVKMNRFMADPAEAKAAALGSSLDNNNSNAEDNDLDSTGGVTSSSATRSATAGGGTTGRALDNAAFMQMIQGLNSSSSDTPADSTDNGNNNASSASLPHGQVDALSNILVNLGMPQQNQRTNNNHSITSSTGATTASSIRSSGILTLSDLQGAMEGLATTSPTSNSMDVTTLPSFSSHHQQQQQLPIPNLDDFVSPDILNEASNILQDESVKARLMELLPEGQRTDEFLMQNIRSPQVAQTLRSLTSALCDDADSFNSILANFQLSPQDGAMALARGNPIQAFLDCVLKSVEREKEAKLNQEGGGNASEGAGKDEDEEMSG